MSAPKLTELVTHDDEAGVTRVTVRVTRAWQDWSDDLQAGDVFTSGELPGHVEFDHVRLFDVIDDDGERYFRVAVPMPVDDETAESLTADVYQFGAWCWGATVLDDVSKAGGRDESIG